MPLMVQLWPAFTVAALPLVVNVRLHGAPASLDPVAVTVPLPLSTNTIDEVLAELDVLKLMGLENVSVTVLVHDQVPANGPGAPEVVPLHATRHPNENTKMEEP